MARRRSYVSCFLGLLLFVAACTTASSPALPTVPAATGTPTSAATAIPTGEAAPPTATSVPPTPTRDLAAEGFVPVIAILSGDTIKAPVAGVTETVRAIGIGAPVYSNNPQVRECYGREAFDEATKQLTRRQVRLIADPTQNDRDEQGRLLRYIERSDGLDFGFWMILNGYARELTSSRPYQRQAEYMAGYEDAKAHEMGFWAPETCNGNTKPLAPPRTPVPRTTRAPATPVPRANAVQATVTVQR